MTDKPSTPSDETPITVKVRYSDYPKNLPLVAGAWEMWVLGKLKSAGMPLLGFFRFQGVERGTLIRTDDFEDYGATIYRWQP